MPRLPQRSKKADCGLTTATTSATFSTTVRLNRSSPAGESSSPQAVSSAGLGSMPTHRGPRSSSLARRRAPNESFM